MSLNIQMNLNRNGGSSSLTVYYEGQSYPATSENPSWDRILEMVMDPNVDLQQLINLLHPLSAFGSRTALSRRVSVAGNRLFFDGDEMSDGLTALIVKLLGENGDVGPFVALLENIMQNPNEHSRKQLYRFIDSNGITITRDGMLVLYKSVYKVSESGYQRGYKSSESGYQSVHGGPAIVNGEPHTSGPVPQDIGDVVEMPRSDVVFEPNVSCSTGLHVGSWEYALTFSGHTKLEVEVHPADVVSVPVDSSDQKMRTCRYRVVGVVTAPYTESVKPDDVADNYCDSANVGTQEPVDTTTPTKHPSSTQFGSARIRAKTAKKGLKSFCQQRMKWTLVDDSLNGTDRHHWSIG